MGAPRANWFHVCVFRPSKYGVRAAILNPMPFVAFSRQRGSRSPHAQVLTCLSSSTGYRIPLRDIAVGQLVVVLVSSVGPWQGALLFGGDALRPELVSDVPSRK